MKKKITFLIIGMLGLLCYLYFYTNKNNSPTSTLMYEKNINTAKRTKFIHNKLWRDNAIEQLEERHGDIIHRIILDDQEYNNQLGLKLIEEAGEVHTAKTRDELSSEVGDVLEVLDCIISLHNLSREDIEQARNKKRNDRGSYLERKFVTTTESIPGSFLDIYCSKDPDKYQLIVE
jgi:predicted house-cleaning noncanonical NTP pyrophosphatase (MazG superfamily)